MMGYIMKNRQMAIGIDTTGGNFAKKNTCDNAQYHPKRKKALENTGHFPFIVLNGFIAHCMSLLLNQLRFRGFRIAGLNAVAVSSVLVGFPFQPPENPVCFVPQDIDRILIVMHRDKFSIYRIRIILAD
jgi:hypothetical protein